MTMSQRMWKREQERKRRERIKRARRRRNCAIVVILLAVITVIAIVLAGRGKDKPKNDEPTPQPVNVASDTKAVSDPYTTTREEDDIKASFFKESAFAGNALAQTIGMYGILSEAEFHAGVNVNLENVYTVTTSGSTTSISEQFKSKRFSKVFLAFGENELRTMTSGEFKTKYKELVDKIVDYQPKARIYLIGIPPVTAEVSGADDKLTAERITEFNKRIMSIAVDGEFYYVDSVDALGDNKDFLPKGVSADGINLNKAAVIDLLYYISKEAYIPDAQDMADLGVDESEDEETDADEDEDEDATPEPQKASTATPAPTVNVLKDSAINKKRGE